MFFDLHLLTKLKLNITHFFRVCIKMLIS
jgi:hypothetical protein